MIYTYPSVDFLLNHPTCPTYQASSRYPLRPFLSCPTLCKQVFPLCYTLTLKTRTYSSVIAALGMDLLSFRLQSTPPQQKFKIWCYGHSAGVVSVSNPVSIGGEVVTNRRMMRRRVRCWQRCIEKVGIGGLRSAWWKILFVAFGLLQKMRVGLLLNPTTTTSTQITTNLYS